MHLGKLIRKGKDKATVESINDRLKTSPFNQALHRLSPNKTSPLYTYSWIDQSETPTVEVDGSIVSVGLIDIPKKKKTKKKKQTVKKKKSKKKSVEETSEILTLTGLLNSDKKEKPSQSSEKVAVKNVEILDHSRDKTSKKTDKKKKKAPSSLANQKTIKPKKKERKLKKEKSSKKNASVFSEDQKIELTDFTNWLNSLKQTDDETAIKTKKNSKKKTKKKKTKSPLKQKINSSVKKKNEIASESLAELYTQQGHYKKAIKVYKQLSLKNPEKSGFFAPLIEELKQKLQ